MKARVFRAGANPTMRWDFAESATIGRSGENTIRLESASVSSRHARIWFDDEAGVYRLEDLGSRNGSKLDGVLLTRAEPLDSLHVVEFGGEGPELIFQALDLAAGTDEVPSEAAGETEPKAAPPDETPSPDETSDAEETIEASDETAEVAPAQQDAGDEPAPAAEAQPQATEAPEPQPVPTSPAEGEVRFYLHFDEPGSSEPIPLPEGHRVVGRARSADVTVESPSVSRRHALLAVDAERVTVQDLGSRNHTFVNGERIEDSTEVRAGDSLEFGELSATLVAGAGAGADGDGDGDGGS